MKTQQGTTAKLNAPREPAAAPIRPRAPSKTDELDTQTGGPAATKGVTPRAPSVVSPREVVSPTPDVRETVTSAVKEAVAPLEKRLAQLEGRLALLESDVRERASAEETRPNAAIVAHPSPRYPPRYRRP